MNHAQVVGRSLAARKHSIDCPCCNSWSAALNRTTPHSAVLVIARMSVNAPVDASWTPQTRQ
jgi:hypothetical protein